MTEQAALERDAALMAAYFKGNTSHRLETRLTGEIREDGKNEAKSLKVKEPINWVAHLTGSLSQGIWIKDESNRAFFAVADVDDYRLGDLDVVGIIERMRAAGLPPHLTRSKSGGIHAWAFVEDGLPYADMQRVAIALQKLVVGSNDWKGEALPDNDDRAVNLPFFGETRQGIGYGAKVGVTEQRLWSWAGRQPTPLFAPQSWIADALGQSTIARGSGFNPARIKGERHQSLITLLASLRARGMDDDQIADEAFRIDREYAEQGIGPWSKGALQDERKGSDEIGGIIAWICKKDVGDSNDSVVYVGGPVPKVADQAWSALGVHTVDGSPGVYKFGRELARINGRVEPLTAPTLGYELARAAQWMAKDKDGNWKPNRVPLDVVSDMLSARQSSIRVPPLMQVTHVPIFSRSGRLIDQDGYDFQTGIFLDARVRVTLPATLEEATSHVEVILADFPFEHQSDRAHAFAMCFEHFARGLWDGPSPLYLVNKPVPGTGATLLVESCCSLFAGNARMLSPTSREDELEKRITAELMSGPEAIIFDNITSLRSPALAMALTTTLYSGRELGKSKMIEAPVRCLWAATGNNPELSEEIGRRTVDIRLDARRERPEERKEFKIPDLREHVRKHRGLLVGSILRIIQEWIDRGRPPGQARKASYEGWASTIGGILDVAGISGFLDTPDSRRVEDPCVEMDKGFIAKWASFIKKGEIIEGEGLGGWVKPNTLATLVRSTGIPFDWGRHFEDSSGMGYKLNGLRDRVFEFEAKDGRPVSARLEHKKVSNSTRYRLVVSDPEV